MAVEEPLPPSEQEPDAAVRYYLFLACAGLLTLGLALFGKAATFALPTVILGALGLLPALLPPNSTLMRIANVVPAYLMPPLVLLSLIFVEVLYGYPLLRGRGTLDFTDVLICAGLLAYLAGQYRLFGLRTQAVPTDERPRADRFQGDDPETWPADASSPRDLIWLAAALPVAIVFGQVGWYWVVAEGEWTVVEKFAPPRFDFSETGWRFASLIWLVGIGAILLVSFLGTWRTYRATADEARMVGQDALWTETRGEQRRTNRWLAWSRRKWFRKTGKLP